MHLFILEFIFYSWKNSTDINWINLKLSQNKESGSEDSTQNDEKKSHSHRSMVQENRTTLHKVIYLALEET